MYRTISQSKPLRGMKCEKMTRKLLDSMSYLHLISLANFFFPSLAVPIKTGATLPATTCRIKRPFSTLRRVKSWKRANIGDDRLSELFTMSAHRRRLEKGTKISRHRNRDICTKPGRLQIIA